MTGADYSTRVYLAALANVLADVPYAQLPRSSELVRLARQSIDRVVASDDPLILHAEAVALRAVASH